MFSPIKFDILNIFTCILIVIIPAIVSEHVIDEILRFITPKPRKMFVHGKLPLSSTPLFTINFALLLIWS